jgi:5'-nucleotidase / UDP-sugar diphosphatase
MALRPVGKPTMASLLRFTPTPKTMKSFLCLLAALLFAVAASAAEPWSLVVCHGNDVHGGVDSSEATFMNAEHPPQLGGAASAQTLINQLRQYARAKAGGFLLLDTGDIFQGTLVGTKSRGEAVMRAMNEMGYDAWVLGNHEFDLGRDVPETLMREAEFPTLSANIYDTSGGTWKHFAQPYTIKNFGEFKVGIIGITTAGTVRAAFEENIKNLFFGPEVPALTMYRDTLRAMGADIIIAACHLGLPFDRWEAWDDVEKREKEGWKSDYVKNAMELVRRVPGIDIMFCGDIHVGYQEPWVDPVNHTPCFQGYGRGTNLLCVEFEFDRQTKKLIKWKPFAEDGSLITLLSDRFPRDRKIAESIDTTKARVETGYDEIIGEAIYPVTRTGEGESLLGNLICDAMRWKLNGDIAITNKGGVRTDLPAGHITPRDVFNVLPFDNTLCAVNVTGQFLKDLMEDKVAYGGSGLYVSGMKIKIDRDKPRGERVVSLDVGGQPYVPDKSYRLVTIDYLLEGNSGMEALTPLRDQAAIESGTYMRDAVIEYIRDHSPLEPKLDGRWVITGGNP